MFQMQEIGQFHLKTLPGNVLLWLVFVCVQTETI